MDSMSFVFLSLLSLLQASFQQGTVETVVVEGLNININILCDLDRELHPVYWRIQEQVYDQYGLPDIFTLRGHEAITLEIVDRRMDGWRLQCFFVDHTRPAGLTPGIVTILRVLVINNNMSIEPSDLLQPSHRGKLTLYFQGLQIQPDTLTIKWLYPPDPSTRACTETRFRIDIYTESQISDATRESDLVPRESFNVNSSTESIDTEFLPNFFFRISAQDNLCPKSGYFYDFYFNDTAPDIHVSGSTVSFEIPEHLLNNRSVQLIWSKDASTQCVCPPVQQFMDTCACNIRHPSNMVTIVNNTLTVSNISQDNMGEGGVTLYFVNATSAGCNGYCNLRNIVRKQRIIITQGYPSSPTLYFTTDDTFCFTIPDNPISAEVYEVELTDITGSQTRLSGIYNTSTCLTITSDLYREECRPFQLSVMAINSIGRAGTTQTINGMQEPNFCGCYRNKEKLVIENVRPGSNSVEFNVSCVDEAILMINTTGGYRMSVSCNSTVTVNSLESSTNYTIYGIFISQEETFCPLNQFRTIINKNDTPLILGIVLSASSLFLLLLIIIPILLCIIKYSFRTYNMNVQYFYSVLEKT